MKKIFSAFLLLACLSVFLVSPAHAAEKKPATISALRKDVDKLQKEITTLAQGQSAIEDRIRVLIQQANQSAKINKPNLYSYP